MPWAKKRQLIYVSIFAFLFIVIFVVPFYSLFYKKPTCFDGMKNGDEQGVDCGGSCVALCRASESAPVVMWQRIFQVEPGKYNAVAYAENPNLNAEAYNVPYTFDFYGSDNSLILEKQGLAYIPPGQNFAVFESNVLVSSSTGNIHTTFDFGTDINWRVASTKIPVIKVKTYNVSGIDSQPLITAMVSNTSKNDAGKTTFVAIVYDTQGNAVAASQTYLDNISHETTANISFSWPFPFSGQVKSCQQPTEVMLDIDRSGSIAPELNDIKSAASFFVDQAHPSDKIGIISFSTTASDPIDQLMTGDFSTVKEAIQSIQIGKDGTQYTNISDALDRSITELTSPRHFNGTQQAIVLLTDGVTNYPELKGTPTYAADLALASARKAESQKIDVYTIGLGTGIDANFLSTIASDPTDFYYASSSTDLASIYSKISASICRLGPAKVDIIPDSVQVIQ